MLPASARPRAKRRDAVVFVISVLVAAACTGLAPSHAPASSAPTERLAVANPTSGSSPTAAPTAAFGDVPMYRMDPARQGVEPGLGRLVNRGSSGGSGPTARLSRVRFSRTEPCSHRVLTDGSMPSTQRRGGPLAAPFKLGLHASSSPVFADGVIAVADGDGYLHGVDAASGAELWRSKPVVTPTNSPVVVDGIVYTMGTDRQAHGFDIRTGHESWTWQASADLGGFAIADGVLYVGTTDGGFHAVAMAGSQQLWSRLTIGTRIGAPIVAGDVVLATTLQGPTDPTGELYAFQRATGKAHGLRSGARRGCRSRLALNETGSSIPQPRPMTMPFRFPTDASSGMFRGLKCSRRPPWSTTRCTCRPAGPRSRRCVPATAPSFGPFRRPIFRREPRL